MRSVVLLLSGIAWAAAVPADAGDAVPLSIVSKSMEAGDPDLFQPQVNITLTLRNDASKTITAWNFSCVYAESDGNFGVGSVKEDAFFQYHWGTPVDADGTGPIEAGGVREVVVPRFAAKGPYEAMSCGADAVVFADRSYSGVASIVDRIFEGRAQFKTDALAAIDLLDLKMAGQGAPEDPLAPGNRYAEALDEAQRAAQAGNMAPLIELRAHLRQQVEIVEKHLPESWGERQASLTSRREGGQ